MITLRSAMLGMRREGYLRMLRPVLWIGLFLLAVEVGVEYRAYLRGWDTKLFGAVRSGHGRSIAAEGPVPVFGPTAEFPFRGPVIDDVKPAGTLRIWIASASHGEDIYLPPDFIFPTLVAKELQTRGIPAQALNASRAGTAIAGDLTRLRREFDRWRPDVVVLYQLSLDIGLLSRRFLAPVGGKGVPPRSNEDLRPPVAPRDDLSWAARLYRGSTTYELLNANVTTRLSAAQLLNDDLGLEAREAFRRTLVDFADGVRALGAEPVLCTFSISASPSSRGAIPPDVVLFVHRWTKHLSARGWLKAVEDLNSVIRDVAREKDALLVDTAAVLTGREDLFRDVVHFTREGHGVIAGAIASVLARRSVAR